MTIYAIGADYANAETSLRAVTDHGGKFVCRYASTPGNPKNLTAPEVQRIHASGLGIVSVFEDEASRALRGHSVGHDDAIVAREQHEPLGLPVTRPIHFTVDFDMQVDQESAVADYFHGIRNGAGSSPVGVYGGLRAATFLHAEGLTDYVWQTYAWSGGKWAPVTHLRQVANGVNWGGFTVDVNEAHAADYGQWSPIGVPTPAPVPTPTNWTDTMITALPTIAKGARDPVNGRHLVARAQAMLRCVARDTQVATDGDFGPITDAAIRAYQGSYGLTVDGIVGPHTWARLLADGTL
jgi:Rv2525c-like, glycoside hydrolase-like domain/Putative peptidoglycan binding domain